MTLRNSICENVANLAQVSRIFIFSKEKADDLEIRYFRVKCKSRNLDYLQSETEASGQTAKIVSDKV